MYLIDSHCHLDFPEFDDDRCELIESCQQNGIKKFVVLGVRSATWMSLAKVAEEFPAIIPAYGLHPYFVEEHQLTDIDQLALVLEKYKPCAIGEIGLDFYRRDLDPEKQRILLREQLKLAEKYQLPVILHVRKAHDEMIQTLRGYQIPGGICHAFNGSLQQAGLYEKLGFKFGFGGAATYENANNLKKLVTTLRLESIVLETDSPDMLPMNTTFTRNTPITLLQVLSVVANLRNESEEQIKKTTTENVEKLLSL